MIRRMSCTARGTSNHFPSSPPKKKAKSEQRRSDEMEVAYPDSDDSFNDEVLAEPSQITQIILQRREATQQALQSRGLFCHESMASTSALVHSSSLRPSSVGKSSCTPMQSTTSPLTPRRYNVQGKSDIHHKGQLLMLKNRLENMERERERQAAMTRDQLIAKERYHIAEMNEKDKRIRQLETQVQSLRQENLQTSFRLHNMTMSGTIDVDIDGDTVGTNQGTMLPTKRVCFPQNDVAWKNLGRFGAAASIFANHSSVGRFGNENASATFEQIPSQRLFDQIVEPVANDDFRNPAGPAYEGTLSSKKVSVPTESKECQASGVSEDWKVQCNINDVPLETLLSISSVCEEASFDVSILSRLCQVREHVELKNCLRAQESVDNDF